MEQKMKKSELEQGNININEEIKRNMELLELGVTKTLEEVIKDLVNHKSEKLNISLKSTEKSSSKSSPINDLWRKKTAFNTEIEN